MGGAPLKLCAWAPFIAQLVTSRSSTSKHATNVYAPNAQKRRTNEQQTLTGPTCALLGPFSNPVKTRRTWPSKARCQHVLISEWMAKNATKLLLRATNLIFPKSDYDIFLHVGLSFVEGTHVLLFEENQQEYPTGNKTPPPPPIGPPVERLE